MKRETINCACCQERDLAGDLNSVSKVHHKLVLLRYIENIKISIRYRYIISYRIPGEYRNFRYIGIKFLISSFTHSHLKKLQQKQITKKTGNKYLCTVI